MTADTRLPGLLALTAFVAWTMGATVEDIGRHYDAFTVGWDHVFTLTCVIAWPAVCGYLIGRGRAT